MGLGTMGVAFLDSLPSSLAQESIGHGQANKCPSVPGKC